MTGPARTPQGLNVEKYRLRLQEMQAQLELDISNQRQDAVEQDGGPSEPGPGQHWEHSGYGDHQADDGTELFEREKAAVPGADAAGPSAPGAGGVAPHRGGHIRRL